MPQFPRKLDKKLEKRKEDQSFRELKAPSNGIDFHSNDYLGFAASEEIRELTENYLQKFSLRNGATGSRLLSGNSEIFEETEEKIARFHNAESALLFNSGYDANIGFFSSVPQKGDIILYDELAHASIRDGLRMSLAKSYKFEHNHLDHLESLLHRFSGNTNSEVYIVTESVFSMDGDTPDLSRLIHLSKKYKALLVIDEAHALGVSGENYKGLVSNSEDVFARIYTYGKAMGCHGAAIAGSKKLKDYLINFARSFIYTTAMSPHSVATIYAAYEFFGNSLDTAGSCFQQLQKNLDHFNAEIDKNKLDSQFTESFSAIKSCVISGNENVKNIALEMEKKGFVIKPILSPTVPAGSERLRFCIHSYNSKQEISEVLKLLGTFVSKA